jgi:hypothetical protein
LPIGLSVDISKVTRRTEDRDLTNELTQIVEHAGQGYNACCARSCGGSI